MDAQACVFCKIVRERSQPENLRGRRHFRFHDIHPLAPVHFMIIPEAHRFAGGLRHEPPAVLGKLLAMAPRLAREQGRPTAFASSSTPDVWAGRRCIICTSTSSAAGSLGPDAETQLKGNAMGTWSIWHWLVVLLIVLLVFGTKNSAISARPGRCGTRIQGRP